MFSRVETLNYRSLRYISRSLSAFQILVGPNASGKTTFFDAIGFLGDLVSVGLEAAVKKRGGNFDDLLFNHQGNSFELAVEVELPEKYSVLIPEYQLVRYEVRIKYERELNEYFIDAETVRLKKIAPPKQALERSLFPADFAAPETILSKSTKGTKLIVNKSPGGNDNYYSEVYRESGKGWVPSFKLGPKKSALANLPEDESKFPVSTWLKSLLAEGVQFLTLNSQLMRQPSAPGLGFQFRLDGSNLPWVIDDLRKKNAKRFSAWIEHIKTALPDVNDVVTVEKPEDKHRYLKVIYKDGLDVPSWTASDGTLRFLALTILAYMPNASGVFLIEEPENGIHPRAIEPIFQSLRSVYRAQLLLATHSPVILALAEAREILCFAKTESGATDIVQGDYHPALQNWQHSFNLGDLFVAGVLQ